MLKCYLIFLFSHGSQYIACIFIWWDLGLREKSAYKYLMFMLAFVSAVNEGGIKQVSNYCPDPGEPENGKRTGSDFR